MTPNCEPSHQLDRGAAVAAPDEQRLRRRRSPRPSPPGSPRKRAPIRRRRSAWPGGWRSAARPTTRRSPSAVAFLARQRDDFAAGRAEQAAKARRSPEPTRPAGPGQSLPGTAELQRVPLRRLRRSGETGPCPTIRAVVSTPAPLPGEPGHEPRLARPDLAAAPGAAPGAAPAKPDARTAGLRPQAQGRRRARPGPGR